MSQQGLIIQIADPHSEEALGLLQASTEFMKSLYPDEWCHVLSVEELTGPEITFFMARLNNVAVGCGALALRDSYAEVKSMYVEPNTRGSGVGRVLLDTILQAAKAKGSSVARLETGYELTAAVGLYRAAGFQTCGAFGDYPDVPASLFMECAL